MSSPPKQEETSELKAGHPPAVKAGGMRITQHKTPHAEKEKPAEPKKEGDKVEGDAEGDNAEEEVPLEPELPRQNLVISGAPARGDEDFPTAAVKAFHEKPIPTHENRQGGNKPTMHIQQPRK